MLVRDWSLITGEGGGVQHNGKIKGQKLLEIPPFQDGQKCRATTSPLKSGNFQYAMLKSYNIRKNYPKTFRLKKRVKDLVKKYIYIYKF